jgi:hypothetical protein
MSEGKKKTEFVKIPDHPDEFEVIWPEPRPDPKEEPTEPWARRDEQDPE